MSGAWNAWAPARTAVPWGPIREQEGLVLHSNVAREGVPPYMEAGFR
jgi:hypothetical protein